MPRKESVLTRRVVYLERFLPSVGDTKLHFSFPKLCRYMGNTLNPLTPMITIIATLVASSYALGMVWMLRSMKNSPEGYQDELGFHEGRCLGVVIDASDEFGSNDKIAA